jgi:hypothetical protein
VESIRIYAGDDVYALLADVENEFSKMSGADLTTEKEPNISEEQRKQLHRAHSQELLSGTAAKPLGTSTPRSGTPPAKEPKNLAGEVLLTNAVFRPERSVLAV